jgi:hypothetical protein
MHHQINHLAVWVLIFAQQGFGALWYSPMLFGTIWLALQGKAPADIDSSNPVPFIFAFVAAVALTYAIAWLLGRLNLATPAAALRVILAIWAAFTLLIVATHYAFLDLSYGLLLIDMGRSLVDTVVSVVVLTLWGRRSVK